MKSINLLNELDSISKIHTLKRDDIDGMMIELAQRILTTLKIERMSVWLFNESKDRVVSMGEYQLSNKKFQKETELLKSKYPNYFKAIGENEILLVPNVYKNTVTEELSLEYSLPNNVISLMDIPLRICGELVGVMCFEKTGAKTKVFTTSEQTFALTVATVFASTLEARQRRALQARLDHELKEKELLVKEVHHRVKNNLTIISSLINFQSAKVTDLYHKSLFEEHRSKLDSIAAIHELVYKSKNFSEINLGLYFQQIVSNLQKVYYSDRQINIELELDEIVIPLDMALPLGLIMNEVITNAYKHAFKEVIAGKISIKLKLKSKTITLRIADNGLGLDLKEKKQQSVGMDILLGLIEQIDGTYYFKNDNGTVFYLEFTTKK